MTDDDNPQSDQSLQDIVDDFGSTELIERVCDKYEHLAIREVLFGEPLSTPHVKRAYRSYDHGQASNKRVSEWGVRIRFDRAAVELQEIKPGGDIHSELTDIADDAFTHGLKDVDIHIYDPENVDVQIEEPYYEVWLIAGSDTQPIQR